MEPGFCKGAHSRKGREWVFGIEVGRYHLVAGLEDRD
jgi:hypothetical protein